MATKKASTVESTGIESPRKTATVLRLVPRAETRADIDRSDTVYALEQLLDLAHKGELIGVAFVGVRKDLKFFVDTAGECHRHPDDTRGKLAALDDMLGMLSRGELFDEEDWRPTPIR